LFRKKFEKSEKRTRSLERVPVSVLA
jgi:hypothetical protein